MAFCFVAVVGYSLEKWFDERFEKKVKPFKDRIFKLEAQVKNLIEEKNKLELELAKKTFENTALKKEQKKNRKSTL